jgi:FkbM family methyltransferase
MLPMTRAMHLDAPAPTGLHADALDLIAEGDVEAGVETLRRAAAEQLDGDVLNDLAVVLDSTGDCDAAETLLRTALLLRPDDVVAAENLQAVLPTPRIAAARPGLAERLAPLVGLTVGEVKRTLFRFGPPVTVALMNLMGTPLTLRPGTSDVLVVENTFVDLFHLPPAPLENPKLILDLGANIGTTMQHFAFMHRGAHVLGVELDAENAALCRDNVLPFSDRCTVVEAGIAATDGVVRYGRVDGDEWGYAIGGGAGDIEAEGLSLDTLLARHAPTGDIDYLKMDIEGAERDVLRAGGDWVHRTRRIYVEVHPPYSPDEARADLERLGFRVTQADLDYGLHGTR